MHRDARLAEEFLTFVAVVAFVVNHTGNFGRYEQFGTH